MKNDFLVEVVVKERVGSHWSKVDIFRGSPERVIVVLGDKYVSRKSLFSRMGDALLLAGEEMFSEK